MGSGEIKFHAVMTKSWIPFNALAVALLAVAVIVLAINEPQCDCTNDLPSAATTIAPQASPPRPSGTGRQRELRKF